MHLLHSATQPCNPVIEIVPPRSGSDGEVYAPSLGVWPVGNETDDQHGFHWAFSLDEAEHLGQALISAAHEAREIFPES